MTYESLSAPLPSEFPAEWYGITAEHFWFYWRARVLQRLLLQQRLPLQQPLRALDIGCGVGLLRRQLEEMTAWNVDGCDISPSALEHCQPARGRTMLYNIHDKQTAFKGLYDVIIMFDVIEHIEDPAAFLKDALWHLKPSGGILVNVPALKGLFSKYDTLVGHFRRYDGAAMRDLFAGTANILDRRYWGFSLLPIAWLRKWVMIHQDRPEQAIQKGFQVPMAWMNPILRILAKTETTFLSHPPLGSSLMVLARKPNTAP